MFVLDSLGLEKEKMCSFFTLFVKLTLKINTYLLKKEFKTLFSI